MLELDHIFIWVDKDAPELANFIDRGFTSIISGSHKQQGTSGKYMFFLNFYIELLYISDSIEAKQNIEKFGNNYIERSNWRKNQSSPFGIGLKMKSFNEKNIPFKYKEYYAEWMRGKCLIMAKNNENTKDPMTFILPPSMEFPCYHTINEMMMDDKPQDFKENHIHKNGIKTLTSYKIFVSSDEESSKFYNELASNGISVIESDKNMIELIFDNAVNKKKLDFRPEFPLIINY